MLYSCIEGLYRFLYSFTTPLCVPSVGTHTLQRLYSSTALQPLQLYILYSMETTLYLHTAYSNTLSLECILNDKTYNQGGCTHPYGAVTDSRGTRTCESRVYCR
jgi:hypothetical protein